MPHKQTAKIVTPVIWKPTLHFRYLASNLFMSIQHNIVHKKLQQLWIDNVGTKQWRNVEIIFEE